MLTSQNTLADWLEWLEQQHHSQIDLGLERIRHVAKILGLLKPSVPVIMVAGTNGKGSTIATLEACYLAQGYNTGVYTSPHLVTFNERIRIKGQPVNDQQLIQAFVTVAAHLQGISLSFFEFTTLAGLLIFAQEALDILILEIGLGGRLDAVNIIDADVALITTIDFDHQAFLGNTLEAIGAEKAGIIRANKPVVIMEQQIPESILQVAKQLQAPLFRLGHEFQMQMQPQDWTWQTSQQSLSVLPYQSFATSNMAAALMAIELLQARLPVSSMAISQGLANIKILGRCQILRHDPCILLDVAHNPQGARYLRDFIQRHKVEGHCYAIFSALADKDITAMVQPLADLIDAWFIAPIQHQRAAQVNTIAQIVQTVTQQPCQVSEGIQQAYQELLAKVTEDDMIVVYGSFYTVAEILSAEIYENIL